MTKQKDATPRLIQLDILRGIAILLILGCHYARYVHYEGANWLGGLNDLFYRSGWMGVDLFFVLSGFLIGGLLFKELRTYGRIDVPRFLVRRAFKIWPLYLVYIGALFLIYAWLHHSFAHAFSIWWPNLMHLQNYQTWTPRIHTWSLAVEEHFYLLLPLLLMVLVWRARKSVKHGESLQSIPFLPSLVAGTIVLCTLLRYLTYEGAHGPPAGNYASVVEPTHLRIDSLFFGVLLAYWHHFFPQRLSSVSRYTGPLLLLGLGLIAPMMWIAREDGPFVSVWGYALLYLGFGAILLALIHIQPQQGIWGRAIQSLPARAIAALGVFSYPIYLWHYDLANVPVRWMAAHGVLGGFSTTERWLCLLGCYSALAIGGGVFWSLLLERPSLALRERCFPATAKPLPTSEKSVAPHNLPPAPYATHH